MVIVVLTVIALIAIPVILGIIDELFCDVAEDITSNNPNFILYFKGEIPSSRQVVVGNNGSKQQSQNLQVIWYQSNGKEQNGDHF